MLQLLNRGTSFDAMAEQDCYNYQFTAQKIDNENVPGGSLAQRRSGEYRGLANDGRQPSCVHKKICLNQLICQRFKKTIEFTICYSLKNGVVPYRMYPLKQRQIFEDMIQSQDH